jgi:hypothetical protein
MTESHDARWQRVVRAAVRALRYGAQPNHRETSE